MRLGASVLRVSRLYSSLPSWIRISQEVKEAISNEHPVVALETAILTHGLPYPLNLETSYAVESIIRTQGAIPATVGFIGGHMCVGLSSTELEMLANCSSPWKVSRRDIPRLLATPGSMGGTTVSGTMVAAYAAGIPIFATGGIGGVHRGADVTWDVSADLMELGRTPVCVVCAGAKSILDLPRTLEVLETQGVCVLSMQCDYFPAFYVPSSGIRSPGRVDSSEVAAQAVDAMIRTKMGSGMILAVPIPEAESGKEVEASMEIAIREAEDAGIQGRDVTPFILDRVAALSDGESVRANLALVKNNAMVAAKVAKELSQIRKQSRGKPKNEVRGKVKTSREVVVVGGSNVDFVCTIDSARSLDDVRTAASYPGRVMQSCGGVGRNIAETVARLGSPHQLLTALGDDYSAEFIRRSCSLLNLERAVVVKAGSTAQYTAILNSEGEVMFGVGDMKIHHRIDSDYLNHNSDIFPNAHVVLVDGNLSLTSLRTAADLCQQASVPLWYEPTDVLKATSVLKAVDDGKRIDFASPNIAEFQRMYNYISGDTSNLKDVLTTCDSTGSMRNFLHELSFACERLESRISCFLIKLGSKGVFYWDSRGRTDRTALWCSSESVDNDSIASVSGCGDSLVGSFIVSQWIHQWPIELCLKSGVKAANESLRIQSAINPSVNRQNFTAEAIDVWGRRLELMWL